MVMRRHVAEENAKRAPPTVHWSIAHLPQRQLAHPWPFPVSVVDGVTVRNVVVAEAPTAPKKQRGNPPGTVVKLRVAEGEIPPLGCYLVLATGRRYRVQAVKGRRIDCMVLFPDEVIEPGAAVWHWEWASRDEKRREAA